jgi:hypothetical protein
MARRSGLSIEPFLLGFFAIFVIIGLIFPSEQIIGSLLGGAAAILVWLLTYAKDRLDVNSRTAKFQSVAWGELMSLALTLGDEISWWEKRVDECKVESLKGHQGRLTKTPLRLVHAMDAAIIQANLDRITDFSPIAADSIVRTLALLRGLKGQVTEFYAIEDRMFSANHAPQFVWNQQMINTIQMMSQLITVAAEALNTARQIDVDGRFHASQQETLRPGVRLAQAREIAKLDEWMRRYARD